MTEDPRDSWRKRAWRRWMHIATVIGDFQSRVVLSLFYFVIVLPFGLLVKLFLDPLGIKGRRTTTWTSFPDRTQTLAQAKKQA